MGVPSTRRLKSTPLIMHTGLHKLQLHETMSWSLSSLCIRQLSALPRLFPPPSVKIPLLPQGHNPAGGTDPPRVTPALSSASRLMLLLCHQPAVPQAGLGAGPSPGSCGHGPGQMPTENRAPQDRTTISQDELEGKQHPC